MIIDTKYREVREQADACMQMRNMYIKSMNHARKSGNNVEAERFKILADECFENHKKAREVAKVEIINQS